MADSGPQSLPDEVKNSGFFFGPDLKGSRLEVQGDAGPPHSVVQRGWGVEGPGGERESDRTKEANYMVPHGVASRPLPFCHAEQMLGNDCPGLLKFDTVRSQRMLQFECFEFSLLFISSIRHSASRTLGV